MLLWPADTPVARPAAETVATDVLEEDQAALDERSFVVPSEYVPVALNCCVAPAAMEGFAGVTAIEDSVAPVGGLLPPPPPQPTQIAKVPITNKETHNLTKKQTDESTLDFANCRP